ncbi:alpha-hydroxy acid oxidase [Devosia rhodophyticola]|uniref:Alpha-hydroxy acid oxidase n=1 Tax=Devosia rhodophyticola TaxID=3026423 RepID=A0ABY7YV69_9HYPH|nr:alpha-hydroxy acid oxidase [Devosia rhodophyticola]WDR04824.1 alpha-hydroxy acid oxidase [Devosia rhodophyticola]
MAALDKMLTIADLKERARRRVPKMFFDYADSGSYTEGTYNANESDFQKIKLRQRVAVNLEGRSIASTMLGKPVAMPTAVAPVGTLGMQNADGEIKTAKACEKFGIPFTLSTMSVCSIEDVAENTTTPFWFQLYVMRDRPFVERLIDRARAANCSTLVLTMDLQILGQRHKDIHNGLSTPPKLNAYSVWQMMLRPEWCMGMLGTKRWTFRNIAGHVSGVVDLGSLSHWTASQFDLTLNWKDVAWIKKRFGGKVIVKGVLDPEDAKLAVEHGADAVIVSNHGGRQLDGAPSSIQVLPEIVDAVGNATEVFMDGGIRSGQDIIKALALGAKGTFLGRSIVYGLGAGGQAGVTRALDIIAKEMDTTMALMGERDILNIGPKNVYSNDMVRD